MGKKMKKIIRIFKKITPFKLFMAILLFPLIVGAIYRLPLPQIICVEVGDLLSFYGVAFGIFSSWLIYWDDKKKREKERHDQNRPAFSINVERDRNDQRIFTITIRALKDTVAQYVYLYDEYISNQLAANELKMRVTFGAKVEELENLRLDRNILCEDDLIDKDGYPKYIQIICDDKEENTWDCTYRKIQDGDNIYYYPSPAAIIS